MTTGEDVRQRQPPPTPRKNPPPLPAAATQLEQQSRKHRQPPAPTGPQPSFSAPTAPPPSGPPIPLLQKYGYHGSIHDLNDRVAQIADAFQGKFGHLPSWGLTFDLLRAPVDDFHSLLAAVPHSGAVARAQAALGPAGAQGPSGKPVDPNQAFVDDLAQASRDGRFADFEAQNRDELNGLLADKHWASKVAQAMGVFAPPSFDYGSAGEKALREHGKLEVLRESARQRGDSAAVARYDRKLTEGRQQLSSLGIGAQPIGGTLGAILDPVARGVVQIAGSLAYSPLGIWQTGKALVEDERRMLAGKAPQATPRIAKQTVQAVGHDLRHPLANPGYAFMDVLGLVSAGAGTGLRIARAAEIAGAGEGFGATVRTLASRPVGGTYELRKGGHSEHVLLFENPVAQGVQRVGLKLRQRALDRRDLNPHARQPLTSARGIDLSSEAKLAREAEARKRVETTVARTYTSDLEKAAGWSLVSSQVFAKLPLDVRRAGEKLPGHAPRGLTRGEQKAIQVLATDDPNPLALHRDFHERMKLTPDLGEPFGLTPEQFIANHDRHLADLTLAGKVLDEMVAGKARKRFVTAVEQTKRVVAEQQRLKVDALGLLPDVAERRIIAPADVMREGKALPDTAVLQKELDQLQGVAAPSAKQSGRITTLTRQLDEANQRIDSFYRSSSESFYLPYVPKRHAKSVPRQLIRSARFGPFGVPMPRELPELKHVFTGKSIIAGDFRIDSTALAGESYGRAVRLVSIRHDHDRLLKMAKDTQREAGPFAVPIRDIRDIDQKLRERMAKIDEGELTAADAHSLSGTQLDAILKELYPDPGDEIPNVKWVDARLIADEGIRTTEDGRIVGRVYQSSPVAGAFDVLNEPFRFSYLFLRPAYALNLLGNAGMGLIHQGAFLPVNLGRALMAEKLYGTNIAHALDALTGEGKMQAIAATAGAGKLTAASRMVAHSWSVLTDRHFRRAALIHELRRQGFRTPEQLHAALFDEQHMPKLVEASRRANKAMVEFDNLTHYEKAILRHIVFVYPWVSRSAVWSLRTLVEHPVQGAVLTELGHEAQQETDPIFSHTPDWIKRVGYIPVGWNADGSPKVINPTSINTFATLNDLLQLAQGGQTPEDFSSPIVEIGIRAFTGADQYGQRYQGTKQRILGPLEGSVQQIPLVRGFTGPKAQPPTKPLDVSDRKAFVTREHEALKGSVLGAGWLGNWGSVIAGGLSPRELNLDAAHARYWRDQPLEARNKHERALVQQGLTMQGELLLKRPPSKDLRQAVDIAGEETLARSQRSQELGRDVPVNSKEGALIDIGVLQRRGRLTTVEAQELTTKLNKLPDAKAVTHFVTKLHDEHGGANHVRDWQADVTLVASFTPAASKARFEDLRRQGLVDVLPAKPKQQDLYEIGRQLLAFQHELAQRKDAHTDDQRGEKAVALAELRAFQDAQDKPVAIGGERYPSVVRLSWSLLTPQEQADHRISAAKGDWRSLTAFDKELLGKRSSPTVSRGWANLTRLVAAYRGQVPMDGVTPLGPGQSIARNQLVYLVKYIDRGEKGYLEPSPGFFKDWLFSQQPRYKRLQTLVPVTKSKFRPQWEHLFADANVLGGHLGGTVYSAAALREAWHGYITGSEFTGWLKRTPAGFRHELDQYGPDFVSGLLN